MLRQKIVELLSAVRAGNIEKISMNLKSLEKVASFNHLNDVINDLNEDEETLVCLETNLIKYFKNQDLSMISEYEIVDSLDTALSTTFANTFGYNSYDEWQDSLLEEMFGVDTPLKN